MLAILSSRNGPGLRYQFTRVTTDARSADEAPPPPAEADSQRSAGDAVRRLMRADWRIVLAWLCLLSLALRSEKYPVLLELGSAEIRLQDILFGVLIVASVPLAVSWARANLFIATALGIFVVLVGVAALRSPVGDPALVAASKYVEFVLAGVAIALNVRRAGDTGAFTWSFVGATCVNVAVALVDSLHSGLDGPLTVRTGGLLSFESAAMLAIVTLVWCLPRVSRAPRFERAAAIVGIVAALVLLLLAKSVLAVAALLCLAVVSARVASRTTFRAAIVGAAVVIVLIGTVGRTADVRSATVGVPTPTVPSDASAASDETPAPPQATPPAPTAAGAEEPPQVGPLYLIRKPAHVVGGSFVHRIALGYVGMRIALESPLIGRGWQSTSSRDFLQQGPYDGYMVDRFPSLDPGLFVSSLPNGPHNAYIQVVAEAGWTAAIALVFALVAALVGGLVAIRRTATESWHTGVGAAWVALVAVFLTSSSLFGGQLETPFLGAAIVLAAPAAGLAGVPAHTWLAAAAALLCVVAAGAALLVVPGADAHGDAITRARVLTDEGRRSELFRRGTVPPGTEVVLENGLLQTQFGPAALTIRPHTIAAAPPTVLSLDPGAPIARQVITHREADVVSIEGRDAGDRPIMKATLRRGVPIVYLWIAPGRLLRFGGQAALLRRSNYAISDYPVAGPVPTTALRGSVDAALVPTARTMVAILSDEQVRLFSPERLPPVRAGQRLTIGVLPRVHDAAGVAGRYFRVVPGRPVSTRVLPENTPQQRRTELTMPFQLDDSERSGLAEFIGFTRAFGRRLGDLP